MQKSNWLVLALLLSSCNGCYDCGPANRHYIMSDIVREDDGSTTDAEFDYERVPYQQEDDGSTTELEGKGEPARRYHPGLREG